jgi:propanol-preferring alcohol dehydrogenase
MKAFQLVEWQNPPELRDVDVPEPGPGEVLIKVGGSGACHSDLHLMEWPGAMLPWKMPFTLGHEVAGWIEAKGPGVEGLDLGEAVAVYGPWGCGVCRNCRMGIETICDRANDLGYAGAGLGRDGGMAEYMLVPHQRHVVPLGELDPAESAPLADAALTPYRAIKRFHDVLVPGSVAVVIGVGGLGHLAIQILRELTAARIVAVDIAEEKLKMATDLGADQTATPANAYEVVQSTTNGLGAELVLDIVGSNDSMALGARLLKRLGAFSLIGLALGTLQFNYFTVPYEAVFASSYWGTLPEFMEVIELARAGKIRMRIEKYPLAEVADVYRRLKDGEIRGRAVIVP